MIATVGPDEFYGDVEEEQTADGLQPRNAQQHGRQGGEDDPQPDGAGAAEDDRLAPVLERETARRHADDDGVVTGEHEIDDDDAENRRECLEHERAVASLEWMASPRRPDGALTPGAYHAARLCRRRSALGALTSSIATEWTTRCCVTSPGRT